jgi:hypothetical protein
MKPLDEALYLREYDELIAATQTQEARNAMREAGLESGKQLLLTALYVYLKREPYLSPEEEEKLLGRGPSSVQPAPKKRVITDTEKRRTVYTPHRVGKHFRFVECGITVEHADGTLHVFLDRMSVGGWTGHLLARSDNAKPTARDIPTTTPFEEEILLAEEAGGMISH